MKRRRIFLSEERLIIFFSRSRQIYFDKFTVIWLPSSKAAYILYQTYKNNIRLVLAGVVKFLLFAPFFLKIGRLSKLSHIRQLTADWRKKPSI